MPSEPATPSPPSAPHNDGPLVSSPKPPPSPLLLPRALATTSYADDVASVIEARGETPPEVLYYSDADELGFLLDAAYQTRWLPPAVEAGGEALNELQVGHANFWRNQPTVVLPRDLDGRVDQVVINVVSGADENVRQDRHSRDGARGLARLSVVFGSEAPVSSIRGALADAGAPTEPVAGVPELRIAWLPVRAGSLAHDERLPPPPQIVADAVLQRPDPGLSPKYNFRALAAAGQVPVQEQPTHVTVGDPHRAGRVIVGSLSRDLDWQQKTAALADLEEFVGRWPQSVAVVVDTIGDYRKSGTFLFSQRPNTAEVPSTGFSDPTAERLHRERGSYPQHSNPASIVVLPRPVATSAELTTLGMLATPGRDAQLLQDSYRLAFPPPLSSQPAHKSLDLT